MIMMRRKRVMLVVKMNGDGIHDRDGDNDVFDEDTSDAQNYLFTKFAFLRRLRVVKKYFERLLKMILYNL